MKTVPDFYGLCPKAPGYEIAVLFATIRQKMTQLYKMAHCGTDIKVLRICHQSAALLVGESGAIYAIFSSAVVLHL